ncbi:lysophospholipid acyltransferase family protein [Chitinimonas viridis]|uniref:Lysophospholipid acyltransferase family protein n=1 Tax=Chitinimonas viridis TaxID=664880 RepID=A0ABT8B9P0_9NEIS|nr:lysophospholipid acyltransferase family protein [Chitinimonas viridis]MDN3578204.1 lysophospholipid acyltransferase family protein [Chitinimonas viridis]
MLTLLLKFLARFPLLVLHAAGILLGWLAWLLDRRYHRQLADNLRQSGLGDYNDLLRNSIAQHGKGALELLAAWGRPADAVSRLVRECQGWEHAEAALAAGRPLIFVTPHLGAFDIAGRYVSGLLPFPITAMYRPPKLRWLEPLMQAGRARDNARTAPATGAGVRLLMKALKAGEATVILPDQAPGAGEGVWSPFFGKPAYTMTLLPRLAQATGATVLFFFAERLDWGRGYKVRIQPMQGEFTGDRQDDAATLNANVEALIRLAPSQYLWSYNRYKQPAGAPPAVEQDKQ